MNNQRYLVQVPKIEPDYKWRPISWLQTYHQELPDMELIDYHPTFEAASEYAKYISNLTARSILADDLETGRFEIWQRGQIVEKSS